MILEGKVLKGLGKAGKAMSQCIEGYKQIIGETIFPGTFNIELEENLYLISPTIKSQGSRFWKVKIVKPKKVDVWIYQQGGSNMPDNQLQIISQHQLRRYLGIGSNQTVTLDISNRHIRG